MGKSHLWLSVWIGLLGLVCSQSAQAESFSITLTSLPVDSSGSGMPLIDVALQNTGQFEETFKIAHFPPADFSVFITTEDGKVVEKTFAGMVKAQEFGAKRKAYEAASAHTVPDLPVYSMTKLSLAPGQAIHETLNLRTLYDLVPGHYILRLAKGPFAPLSDQYKLSNALDLFVR
jgi:hypothetical protein